jgi:hypothetical protein
MNQPITPPPDSGDASLQFDRAEYTEPPPATLCSFCKRAIDSTYFEANGHLLCPSCRESVEASMTGGSKSKRFFKAGVFGFGAAVAGALVYYGVSLTGYNIGLIAVLVGWMVGTAVSKGSDGRGGWFYQTVAVVLTYLAVGASLAPDLYQGMQQARANSTEQTEVNPAVSVVTAGVFSVGLPVLVAMESPISGLIYSFALYEAWRRNKKPQLNIAGPFKLAAPEATQAEAPAPEAERSVG